MLQVTYAENREPPRTLQAGGGWETFLDCSYSTIIEHSLSPPLPPTPTPSQSALSPSSDIHYIGLKGVHCRGTELIYYVNLLTHASVLFTALHSFIFL